MSSANNENQGSTPKGTDGRMLARARRQAMSHSGKMGVLQPSKAAAPSPRSKPSLPVATPDVKVGAAAPERRESAATPKPAGNDGDKNDTCGCKHEGEQQTLEAICALVEAEPAAFGSSTSSARQLCQLRRQALSSQGKSALKPSNNSSSSRRNGTKAAGLYGLSGRAAAQARREDLCTNGRGDSPVCRPTGRVRTNTAAPAKVEEGSTLRGNLVTGTQVERTGKITGIESGSCRSITGTEYIGTEQYAELCTTVPAPAAAKVASSSTSRGQRVSGTELSRSVRVTGDDRGTCKSVTGNEYISAELLETVCESKPAPGPAKVGMSATHSGQRVSGTDVSRSSKVTGDESGACQKLTGSQYYRPDPSGNVCQGSGVPHKVSVMSTVRERTVTGTNVAASAAVTGSEFGACAGVTGTEYAGLQQYQACNRTPVLTPEKVTVMRTFREQPVSGTTVEHNPKVTGDEYGGCQPISGTEYIGPDQYAEFCGQDDLAALRERVASRRGAAGMGMTGVRQAADNKVTGRARGEAQRLSGTLYSDDAKPVLSGAVGTSQHHLTRGPADRSHAVAVANIPAPVLRDFSVQEPARTARASQLNRITGTAYGAQNRITGPVNLAAGLVSGTPEFRYREDGFGNVVVAKPIDKEPVQAIAPTNRVTGDGRESGFTITGAAWKRGGRTTGTEGTSASRRNPTQRGDQRSMAMQALGVKAREQVQVPPSKVTGSSGNSAKGSTITYSGGARG